MSSIIEYNRVVFKTAKGELLLFLKEGHSHSFNLNNLRKRDWVLAAFGSEKEIWKFIGKRAGYTEGGKLLRATGWSDVTTFNIEEYVKLYRSKISHAKAINTLMDYFKIHLVVQNDESPKDSVTESCMQRIIEEYGLIFKGINYYQTNRTVYETELQTVYKVLCILKELPSLISTTELDINFTVTSKVKRV
ncbi:MULTISPECIES: hypothetical protein [Bacillus]|uniref:hypothetical protein n=1 Tax=Bacillus TaxID=1386 RepID=UPI000C7594C7|nr:MULTISPECIES: hypothetical protein [Bacillus]MCP1161250.1 hypothetical protein [Bacillus infantis]PLR70571.1 hypothetical protein CYJ37_23870 [Bacillus sp. UMB0728]